MGLVSDLKTLYHVAFAPVKGTSHQARLESFYSGQADAYDDFRKRLLHGREEMMRWLPLAPGMRMLDMGGGTGSNIESLGDRLSAMQSVTIVDLCGPLLETAKARITARGWTNVDTAHTDVTVYEPAYGCNVDVVTFSYSLTMIPDWFRALQQAWRLLKPGGLIGVVDFYIARKWPTSGMKAHSWLQRLCWPAWFASDNVYLSWDHIPWLQAHFEPVVLEERLGKVPYMLGLKAPHYIFIGRKPLQ
ncbi:MAG: class I SAM-dependent methyltransferase [Planctomycetia bacterium]|nr:class I SAM-dependent methyltransferase [Planctomycetia bacterium]